MIRSLVKGALGLCGYVNYRKSFLPKGVDWVWDISRLCGDTPVQVIFDVGANEGQTSKHLAREFPRAAIYAFEPSKVTHDILRSRMAEFSQVLPRQIALGDSPGRKSLLIEPGWTQMNRIVDHAGETPLECVEQVQVTTIDEFCTSESISRIDILKTDTEGYDLQVLRGGDKMLEAVQYVVSEVTFAGDDALHTRFHEVDALLSGVGFGLYALYHYEHRPDKSLIFCDALWCRRGQ
jgi:FkbM family methyltransferase